MAHCTVCCDWTSTCTGSCHVPAGEPRELGLIQRPLITRPDLIEWHRRDSAGVDGNRLAIHLELVIFGQGFAGRRGPGHDPRLSRRSRAPAARVAWPNHDRSMATKICDAALIGFPCLLLVRRFVAFGAVSTCRTKNCKDASRQIRSRPWEPSQPLVRRDGPLDSPRPIDKPHRDPSDVQRSVARDGALRALLRLCGALLEKPARCAVMRTSVHRRDATDAERHWNLGARGKYVLSRPQSEPSTMMRTRRLFFVLLTVLSLATVLPPRRSPWARRPRQCVCSQWEQFFL